MSIKVVINQEGEISASVEGVQGASCAETLKKLAVDMGGEISKATNTEEYYEEPGIHSHEAE